MLVTNTLLFFCKEIDTSEYSRYDMLLREGDNFIAFVHFLKNSTAIANITNYNISHLIHNLSNAFFRIQGSNLFDATFLIYAEVEKALYDFEI